MSHLLSCSLYVPLYDLYVLNCSSLCDLCMLWVVSVIYDYLCSLVMHGWYLSGDSLVISQDSGL